MSDMAASTEVLKVTKHDVMRIPELTFRPVHKITDMRRLNLSPDCTTAASFSVLSLLRYDGKSPSAPLCSPPLQGCSSFPRFLRRWIRSHGRPVTRSCACNPPLRPCCGA